MNISMDRRTVSNFAVCGGLLFAASVVPLANAGNVAWSVSVGGPGFSVTAGQPGFYGGRGFVAAPFRPYARPFVGPVVRGPWVGPAPVAFAFVTPVPVAFSARRVAWAPRAAFSVNRPFASAPFHSASY